MRNVVVVVIVRVELVVVVVDGGVVVVSVSVMLVTVVDSVAVLVTEVVEVVDDVTEVVETVVVGLSVVVVVVVVGTQSLPDITSGFELRRGVSCGRTLFKKQTRARPGTLFALPHVHAPQRGSFKHSVRQAPAFGIGPSFFKAICVKKSVQSSIVPQVSSSSFSL